MTEGSFRNWLHYKSHHHKFDIFAQSAYCGTSIACSMGICLKMHNVTDYMAHPSHYNITFVATNMSMVIYGNFKDKYRYIVNLHYQTKWFYVCLHGVLINRPTPPLLPQLLVFYQRGQNLRLISQISAGQLLMAYHTNSTHIHPSIRRPPPSRGQNINLYDPGQD